MLLRTEHPTFGNTKLSTERIFKKLYPKRVYDHKRMINLMSEFNTLLEKYLVTLQLGKKDILQQKLLVEAYGERSNCYKAFEKNTTVLHKKLNTLPYRDELYFSEKKDLYLQVYAHPGTEIQQRGKEILEIAIEYFETSKEIVELKLKCASNARVNTIRETPNKVKSTEVNTVSDIYRRLDKIQRSNEDDGTLKELTAFFISNIDLFRQADQSNILKIILNFSTRLINQGKLESLTTSLELYKIGLEKKCLSGDGKLSQFTFINIIGIGTHCREFEWTKLFIETYKTHLPTELIADVLSLAWAKWYFAQGVLTEAEKQLKHSFKNTRLQINGKALLIKIRYDLYLKDSSYFELLLNQLESFEKIIRREKLLPEQMVTGYLKFIVYTKKMIQIGGDLKSRERLRQEILNETNLVLKSWLLDRLK